MNCISNISSEKDTACHIKMWTKLIEYIPKQKWRWHDVFE